MYICIYIYIYVYASFLFLIIPPSLYCKISDRVRAAGHVFFRDNLLACKRLARVLNSRARFFVFRDNLLAGEKLSVCFILTPSVKPRDRG